MLIFSFSFNNKLLNKIVTGVLFTGEICYNQLNIIIGGEVLFNINKSISTCTDTGIGTLVIGKTYTCKRTLILYFVQFIKMFQLLLFTLPNLFDSTNLTVH